MNVHALRLKVFRESMVRHGIDMYIVCDADPHSSEYVAEHWKARTWLSGFDGSNGTLAVTAGEARLWTDGRYRVQAKAQLEGTDIEAVSTTEPGAMDYPEWIADRLKSLCENRRSVVVGVDGRVVSCEMYEKLKRALVNTTARIEIGDDIIGEIWTDGRPEQPRMPVFLHDFRFAGESVARKLKAVRGSLVARGVDVALICGLEDVAWLMNIRGGDVPYLPVAYAYALVSHRQTNGGAELFIETDKLSSEAESALVAEGVKISHVSALAERLSGLCGVTAAATAGDGVADCCVGGADMRFLYDPQKMSRWLFTQLPPSLKTVACDEPTIKLKAIKNSAELMGHRECQLLDGAAMVRLLMWIERAARENSKRVLRGAGNAGVESNAGDTGYPRGVSEWDAAEAARAFRAGNPQNRGESFNTIVGYAKNGAMMHYAPTKAGSSQIWNRGLMVVDSGGQYFSGTTDITRTVVFDETTPEERRDFTLTLKAHISLASARFLYGASGAHIDAVARKVMWDEGLDYKSGTGHGIGSYLGVHEGPQSISMRGGFGTRLEENMIVSIEPGVYREDKHGVRIENLVCIREDFENEFGRFMCFEMLSFCPISLAGIEVSMLDRKELDWLNNYHRKTYSLLSPLLNRDEREWLSRATAELIP